MKKILSVLLVVSMILGFGFLTASASNIVELPLPPNAINGGTQQGWGSPGFEDEGLEPSFTMGQFLGATELVLEVSEEPHTYIQFILQSPAGWWQQTAFDGDAAAAMYSDGKITFDLTTMPMELDFNDLRAKFLIGYYDPNIEGLGITRAYLVVPEEVAIAPPIAPAGDLIVISAPGNFCGAQINVGQLNPNTYYTVVFNVTTHEGHNGGFRVRYHEDKDTFTHNDTTNAAHSTPEATAVGYYANQVPANFPNETVAEGETVDLTVEFMLNAEIPDLDPAYMDWIGIFGYWGSPAFQVNSVTIIDDVTVIAYAEYTEVEEEEEVDEAVTAPQLPVVGIPNAVAIWVLGLGGSLVGLGSAGYIISKKRK